MNFMITLGTEKVIIRKPYVIDPIPVEDCSDNKFDVVRKKYDENGNATYVKVGEEDISQTINSYKNVCSLESMLSRVSLLPLRDKISYLQQEDNVSADLTSMPSDGTEAFIYLQNMAFRYPDIYKRLSSGESIDNVLKSLNTDINKEDPTNGKTEPSNE